MFKVIFLDYVYVGAVGASLLLDLCVRAAGVWVGLFFLRFPIYDITGFVILYFFSISNNMIDFALFGASSLIFFLDYVLIKMISIINLEGG